MSTMDHANDGPKARHAKISGASCRLRRTASAVTQRRRQLRLTEGNRSSSIRVAMAKVLKAIRAGRYVHAEMLAEEALEPVTRVSPRRARSIRGAKPCRAA